MGVNFLAPMNPSPNHPNTARTTLQSRHNDTTAELAKYKLLIDSVQDYAIFLLDTKGYVMTWNKGAERTKGYKDYEIIGQHFSRFYSEHDIQAHKPERELEIAIRVGRIEDEDWRIRKDGSRFWANVIITALREDDGELVGFAKVTRDLTERKQQEDELRHANVLLKQQQRELQSLNASKDEFISLASHQLRTPATAVKLVLSSLIDGLYGEIDPAFIRPLTKAYDSNERQIAIVDRLLKVAQADAGRVVLRKELTDITELVRGIIDEHHDSFGERHQTVSFDAGSDVWAEVDEQNFRMALSNIIDNSSKYSYDDSEIAIAAHSNDREITVSVRDQGVGISPDDLERLFGKFERIQNAMSHKVSGSGLGLFWANRIIELHGGRIEVKSIVGKGTTFYVILPRAGGAHA